MRRKLVWVAYRSLRPGVVALLVASFVLLFGMGYLAAERFHSPGLAFALFGFPLLIQAAIFFGIRFHDGFRQKVAYPDRAKRDMGLHLLLAVLSALIGVGLMVASVWQ